MAIGARVRAMFGPFEPAVSNLWRSMFIDLDDWTRVIREWVGPNSRVLEVGCGEGYSTARLVAAFPTHPVDAIDIAGDIGRLYNGPSGAVIFRKAFVEDIAVQRPGHYDLVVLTDVLHHVPVEARAGLLAAIRTVLRPGGILAVKDWHRNATPIHWAVHGADRWLTGDRVHYMTRDEARVLLESVFGSGSIRAAASIRPWSNNYAFCIAA